MLHKDALSLNSVSVRLKCVCIVKNLSLQFSLGHQPLVESWKYERVYMHVQILVMFLLSWTPIWIESTIVFPDLLYGGTLCWSSPHTSTSVVLQCYYDKPCMIRYFSPYAVLITSVARQLYPITFWSELQICPFQSL